MLSEHSLGTPAKPTQSILVRNQKFLFGALIVALAVGYLVTTSLQNTAMYYVTIPELRARPASVAEIVRVNGKVVNGTISPVGTGQGVRFTMHDDKDVATSMVVSYKGLVPDTFQDNADVVVEGKLNASGEFDAVTLLAKCPSKFTADGNT